MKSFNCRETYFSDLCILKGNAAEFEYNAQGQFTGSDKVDHYFDEP